MGTGEGKSVVLAVTATIFAILGFHVNVACYSPYLTKRDESIFKAFFEDLNFDSLTVAPYMGRDSVEPFLAFKNKFTILLALTSNIGGLDFQTLQTENHQVYEEVLKKSLTWNNAENLMYVVGATRPDYFKTIRKIVPNHFLLVPGVGAQGGSLQDVCQYGLNNDVGLLVNSSRGIIYASNGKDFAEKAAKNALELQQEMKKILIEKELLA